MRKTILNLAEFRKRVGAGRKPRAAVRLLAPSSEPQVTAESRVVRFVLSDGSVDRYGDTINARGWVLTNYMANPVVLFGHDAETVENVIGRMLKVWVDGESLLGEVEFMEASVNPTAETVFQMVKGRYLNTGSVGFQPIEYGLSKDKNRPAGIDFKKQELLEFSIVPIPANPNALVQARAAGIDVDRLGLVQATPKVSKKGLYEVACLARLLSELGYLEDMVEFEEQYEGDASDIGQRLTDAMKLLGQILVDMTVEEVNELVAEEDGADPIIMVDDPIIMESLTPAQKAIVALVRSSRIPEIAVDAKFEAAVEKCVQRLTANTQSRAGKVLSSKNEKALRDAHDMIVKGCEMVKGIFDGSDGESADDQQKAIRERRIRALKLQAAVA